MLADSAARSRFISRLDPFEVGTEHEEFFIDVFVAAVDVIEAVDGGGALCC